MLKCSNCKMTTFSGSYNRDSQNKLVFKPRIYYTYWKGNLCSTGCCMNWININSNASKIQYCVRRKLLDN